MSLTAILKLLHVYLLATIKYFVTFPYSLLIGLNFTQTIIVVTIGGISGFFFFFYLSGYLIRLFHVYKHFLLSGLRSLFHIDLRQLFSGQGTKSPKRRVTRKTRLLVNLRKRYGFWGIIIMTPSLLSIPIGAFLLKKYYPRRKNAATYMTISILGWALLFSSIFIIFPQAQ